MKMIIKEEMKVTNKLFANIHLNGAVLATISELTKITLNFFGSDGNGGRQMENIVIK